MKSKSRKQAKNGFFWGITAIFFLFQLLPWLVKQGMFLDGVTYSAISRNLAMGLGSAWSPHYTQTFHPQFFEHPPLVFIIQSWFFSLLGDGLYVEKIFTFLTAVLSAWGIYKIWTLFENKEEPSFAWIPVFLWISIPAVVFSFRNNMLDNVVSVFTLFAVYFITRAILSHQLIYSFISTGLILGAFLSKGPVGLFPLVLPFLYMVAFRSDRKPQKTSNLMVILATFTLGLLLLFYFVPESRDNLSHYFNQQLIPALKDEREIRTSNRFFIVGQVFSSLALPLALILLMILLKPRALKINPTERQRSFFFLLIALSASLPLLATLKQSRIYLLPSLPFYVMAISYLFLPFIKNYLGKITLINRKFLITIQLVLLVLLLLFTANSYQNFDRDKEMIQDVKNITDLIPHGSIISTTGSCDDWVLIAYLSRFGNISLDCQERHDFYLLPKNKEPNSEKFALQNSELNLFNLYIRK